MKHAAAVAFLVLGLALVSRTGTLITADQISLGPGLAWQTGPTCTNAVGPCLTFNTAVIPGHVQIQQASDLRCASQNGTQAYTCGPCPPTGSCTGIGPNPVINQITYGMELQFIADVPCSAAVTPLPCTINADSNGSLSIFVNNGSASPAPATFGSGFHRVVADLIGVSQVWRLEY